MVTIGEVLELLMGIFEALKDLLGDYFEALFGGAEEDGGETTQAAE